MNGFEAFKICENEYAAKKWQGSLEYVVYKLQGGRWELTCYLCPTVCQK